MSGSKEQSTGKSGSPASWKDTFLMVGGAVIVAALLEGARRLSGKKFGSLSEMKTSLSEVTSSIAGRKPGFESGGKRGKRSASSEPGKRIHKSKTSLKGKSGYPSQVGGKSSKKKSTAGNGSRRVSREY